MTNLVFQENGVNTYTIEKLVRSADMKYDEEDTYEDDGWDDEEVHSDDWGDTESEEEEGFDDDERD